MGCMVSQATLKQAYLAKASTETISVPHLQLQISAPAPKPQHAISDQKVAELPIMNLESKISSINSSGRPQWGQAVPAKEIKVDDIDVRAQDVNQSAVNVAFSSDAHELFNQKLSSHQRSQPFSLIVQEEPIGYSPSSFPSKKYQFSYPAKQNKDKLGRNSGDLPKSSNSEQEPSVVVKRATSVIQDCNIFNEEKIIDIISFDLRFLKVEIKPQFPQSIQQ